jgi:hypothetical protein
MLDKLKKNGVKFLVFAINILLAAIAVLIIREKDQARLLTKAQEDNPNKESLKTNNEALPSFKNTLDSEIQSAVESIKNNLFHPDIADQAPPVENVVPVPATTPPAAVPSPKITPPADTVPTPVPQTKPSNAQTKTS